MEYEIFLKGLYFSFGFNMDNNVCYFDIDLLIFFLNWVDYVWVNIYYIAYIAYSVQVSQKL